MIFNIYDISITTAVPAYSGKRNMRCNRGFTLVELLVVIAIIGIIATIAVPNLMDYLSRTRLKTACREVCTHLQYVRDQAMGSDEPWRISFVSGAGCYHLLDGSNKIVGTIDLGRHRGISFGSNNSTPIDANHVPPQPDGVTYVGEKVKFNPDGTATAGTVYLKNDRGDTMAVGTVSATGRIKIWRDFGGGWKR